MCGERDFKRKNLGKTCQVTIESDSLSKGIDYSCSLSRARFEGLA